MARPVGSPKLGGRQKGTPNKDTKEIRLMIAGALEAKGGQAWFEKQMEENPVAMIGLIGRSMPKEITADITGSMEIQTITRQIIDVKPTD